MCFLIPGQTQASAYPPCLPQCIATLMACPGFWLDDIKPACSSISFPPFCSFSVFVQNVPPQISSYEQGHLIAANCPPRPRVPETSAAPIGIINKISQEVSEIQEEIPLDRQEIVVQEEPLFRVPKIKKVPRCDCKTVCDSNSPIEYLPTGCDKLRCSCKLSDDTTTTTSEEGVKKRQLYWTYHNKNYPVSVLDPAIDEIDRWIK